jgi:hypothetical protein
VGHGTAPVQDPRVALQENWNSLAHEVNAGVMQLCIDLEEKFVPHLVRSHISRRSAYRITINIFSGDNFSSARQTIQNYVKVAM